MEFYIEIKRKIKIVLERGEVNILADAHITREIVDSLNHGIKIVHIGKFETRLQDPYVRKVGKDLGNVHILTFDKKFAYELLHDSCPVIFYKHGVLLSPSKIIDCIDKHYDSIKKSGGSLLCLNKSNFACERCKSPQLINNYLSQV